MITKKLYKLIFPEKCILCGDVTNSEAPFCSECFTYWSKMSEDVCYTCGEIANECQCVKINYAGSAVFAFWYGTEPLKSLIYRLKTTPCRKTAKFFASILSVEIRRKYTNKRNKLPFDTITFVPRSRASVVKYGHDQAKMLANEISKQLQIPCICLLERRKDQKQQKTLSYSVRLDNIRGVFEPLPRCQTAGKVLLVDDVITTGATMGAAVRALRDGGVKSVRCAAIAKTNLKPFNESELKRNVRY